MMTVIPAAQMARDALTSMSEAERVSFAIEIVNGLSQPASAFGLIRLANFASDMSAAMLRRQQEAN